ncbi:unnamed protein product [Miscanthus lutarioriparius]|uniref:Uncharacterized protein n=1 Tax=Miscanthus lutarioriparius TaxID=422564 RepID=A0A811S1D3_9POAL|nr:unnamed protein product [Miscanthus lutarioriparius]
MQPPPLSFMSSRRRFASYRGGSGGSKRRRPARLHAARVARGSRAAAPVGDRGGCLPVPSGRPGPRLFRPAAPRQRRPPKQRCAPNFSPRCGSKSAVRTPSDGGPKAAAVPKAAADPATLVSTLLMASSSFLDQHQANSRNTWQHKTTEDLAAAEKEFEDLQPYELPKAEMVDLVQ